MQLVKIKPSVLFWLFFVSFTLFGRCDYLHGFPLEAFIKENIQQSASWIKGKDQQHQYLGKQDIDTNDELQKLVWLKQELFVKPHDQVNAWSEWLKRVGVAGIAAVLGYKFGCWGTKKLEVEILSCASEKTLSSLRYENGFLPKLLPKVTKIGGYISSTSSAIFTFKFLKGRLRHNLEYKALNELLMQWEMNKGCIPNQLLPFFEELKKFQTTGERMFRGIVHTALEKIHVDIDKKLTKSIHFNY